MKRFGWFFALVAALPLVAVSPSHALSERNGPIFFVRETARGLILRTVTLGGTHERIGPSAGGSIAVSPDGRWILMSNGGTIYKARSDGSRRVRLTDEGRIAGDPAWSPDGSKIVFVGADYIDDGYMNLYVMNADGSRVRRLTSETGCEREPAWSPDGSTIAFVRLPAVVVGYGFFCAGDPDLYSITPSGSDIQALTTTPQQVERSPDWSPDSSTLAFVCGEFLCKVELGGTPETIFDKGAVGSPAWSPDGRFIAFSFEPATEEDIDSEIAVVRSDGSGLRRLTQNHATDLAPDWGPR